MANASPLALFELAETMLGKPVTEKQEDIDNVLKEVAGREAEFKHIEPLFSTDF